LNHSLREQGVADAEAPTFCRAGWEPQEKGERICLVTFMHYNLGYFDDETCRLEPIANPFAPTVLPMSSV
jgi:hypothetical protein